MGLASAGVYDLKGNLLRRLDLPNVFVTSVRPDVIRRAAVAVQSHKFQPKGRNLMAGKRTSAKSFGVGRGAARVPRVRGERYPRAGMGAFAPSTVKGRRAHPPTTDKTIKKKINRKELRLALASAMAATARKELVAARGHIVEDLKNIPMIASDELQKIKRTQELREVFQSLGVWRDVERVLAGKKHRSGSRSAVLTRYGVGPLIVVAKDEGVGKAARNIPGVEVSTVSGLNVGLLAPGTKLGRLTVWTESAVRLFDTWRR